MADIVDRLRGFADLFEAQHAPGNLVLHVRAGADEIERKNAEIASLLNMLADTRTENMRLRAALENCWTAAAEHHTENVSRCEWSGSSIAQKKARAIAARSGVLLHNIKTIARAALEEGRT